MRDDKPDWREEAWRKLADSRLTAAEREEMSRELAGYLEDLCADALARGLDDSAAGQIDVNQIAAAELHEDAKLGAHLHRARKERDFMNDRTRQLWLPGFAILLLAEAVLYTFQPSRFEVQFWIGHAHRWAVGIISPGCSRCQC